MASSKEYMREYNRKYYQANKEKIKTSTARYRVNNRDKYNAQKRKWNEDNPLKRREICEKYREKIRFGGNKKLVLERDEYRCQMCGSEHDLHVHHKDGNNHTKVNPNHHPDNLITLCHSCHSTIHYDELGHPLFRKVR